MHAILIHGMGRTPTSMLILAIRLRTAGIHPHFFAYSAAFEGWNACVNRLEKFINRHTRNHDFIIIGHSLGTVLTRGVLPKLTYKPRACFFLAPPTKACAAAQQCAPLRLYKLLTGEMGQLLANPHFMDALPTPDVPTNIYSGINGLRGRHSPFGEQLNDGVLTVEETLLPNIPYETIPAVHTFIMNKKVVAEDIIKLINTARQPVKI
ncbi:MAG: alpha/beta hydrolase [Methylococcales bacterium]|nr:alpha/beta hydrolase [Methylococcales bacterium]